MNNSYSRNVFSNNNSSFNVINNYTTVSDERARILSWISPLESWKRHTDVVRDRAKGVGEWVLQRSEFQEWQQDGNDRSVGRILFCHGVPGAGKTFICSLVIDTLCDRATGPNVAVGCLYCDYRGQEEQTPDVMIGSLLRQFVTGLPEVPEAITQAFRAAKTHLGGRVPELAKIIELFPTALERFQEVFICVDALDEFVEKYRAGFLRSLRQILDKSTNTKLFLTARSHIQSALAVNIPLDMSVIKIQPLFSDIETYITTKLDADPHQGAMSDGLRSEILTKILKESSEIFLLVTLQVDSILGEVTIGGRRKKLREMTNDLRDSYIATLKRIRGQRGALARFGISALMWISLAERPLLVGELCHALAMEVGSPDIDTEMVPPIETVVASCMGLVTIDQASSTVRLVHATLQENLCSDRNNVFQNPHATIADVCLSYLGTQSIRNLPSDLETAPDKFPLLAYASCYWGAHARKELTTSVKHRALGILDRYHQHAAATIFLSSGGAPWNLRNSSAGFSGLHYVAYFGIDGLLEAVLGIEQANLNQADEWGRTPLALAAEKGNEGVIRMLLSNADVNPNSPDLGGRTPLSLASGNSHYGVIRMLLGCTEVNPNLPDLYSRTPLFLASENGCEGVVGMILGRAGVDPNLADRLAQTPLSVASANGHEGAVRTLLGHVDVNPNSTDWLGQTPLFHASEYGHEGVVMMLLDHPDINPDLPDHDDRTPLFRASAYGHEGVVRILLSRADVNPNAANLFGHTPLSIAAFYQQHGVAELLRARQ